MFFDAGESRLAITIHNWLYIYMLQDYFFSTHGYVTQKAGLPRYKNQVFTFYYKVNLTAIILIYFEAFQSVANESCEYFFLLIFNVFLYNKSINIYV